MPGGEVEVAEVVEDVVPASAALTTVRHDIATKGRLSAAALAAVIDHARKAAKTRARHHVLPTELIVRQSS